MLELSPEPCFFVKMGQNPVDLCRSSLLGDQKRLMGPRGRTSGVKNSSKQPVDVDFDASLHAVVSGLSSLTATVT